MGKKRYYQQDRVGSSKYTISYHDGKKKHKDGSDFFDIQTFKNKKDLAKFVNILHKGGYVYGFNESVNEASKEAMGIAGFTGTRGVAVDDFIKKNKIDARKLFNFVKKGNLKDRMAFVAAIAGRPNNKMFKMITKQFGESVNERINPKFYDARVQYIDPKSKKKFVGDVVRYDNGEYKVNLGKDGRFEKYILAKEKDLKIVSKSKKKTFESVNENSQARSLYIQIYKRHGKSEKKFYDRLEYLEKKMGKREFDIVIDNGLRGFKQNPKKYKTDAAKQERLFQLVKQAAK